MSGKSGRRRWRFLENVGVALYAVFLVTAQFEHHDLLCHLRTPQHCTSCTSSQLGSDPHTPAVLAGLRLPDAGSALTVPLCSEGAVLPVRTAGRSPPAIA